LQFSDPRDPPIIPSSKEDGQGEAVKDMLPRHAHAAPTPTYQAPATPVHTGNISDDIERDAKGGLIRVGKYKIVRKMGFGSAGDVFEGFDTHMGRKVAIKTITKNASSHFDRAAERFVLEAKAAGSLNHPCINTVYDFGTVREVSYMVLEYLDGITLSQWMRNNPTPPTPQAVAHWLQQVSSALDFAHGNKVIHRDLKPANLMVVNNGATIKLLDFGIAKMEDVGLTQTGMTVGTPSYMSPEQLSGLKVNPASDQYGLAVVIYQLLTYKLPYIGTKIPELCNRILKNDLVPIIEVNPALGEAFWEALRKGMAKAPEDRYANCMEMYHALEASFPLTDPAYV
jgi:serine/threonine-protein kinase